jgi:hypothetical protein
MVALFPPPPKPDWADTDKAKADNNKAKGRRRKG